MHDPDFVRKLRELDAKLEGLDADSSISLIDCLLSQETSQRFVYEMMVKKGMILSSQGMSSEAISLFEHCASFQEADEGAAYYAAELHVAEHRYQDAVRCLEVAERQMAVRGSNYYASCIYLLHAYCAAKLGDFTDAKLFLEKSVSEDDELTLFWVKTRPIISAQVVEGLIAEGKSP